MKPQHFSINTIEKKSFSLAKLLDLFYLANNADSSKKSSHTGLNWLPYLYYRNPINLLFSNDQFLYEFLLKYPQRKKMSEYKLQLKEQKKLSLFYGSLPKKQLQKYFVASQHAQGEFSRKLLSLLETRLDVIIYRSQFVKTLAATRQLIVHGKVLVNHKIVSIPSYHVKPGDVVAIPDFQELQLGNALLHNFKAYSSQSQAIENQLRDWRFPSRFLSQNQLKVVTKFLIKKILQRAAIQNIANPFLEFQEGQKYSKFHIYTLNPQANSHQQDLNIFKKFLFQTLSNFQFDDLEKEIFFLALEKNLAKKFSKNRLVTHINTFGIKPIHLEISYKLFSLVVLYSPQRIYYPFPLNFDLLKRGRSK